MPSKKQNKIVLGDLKVVYRVSTPENKRLALIAGDKREKIKVWEKIKV